MKLQRAKTDSKPQLAVGSLCVYVAVSLCIVGKNSIAGEKNALLKENKRNVLKFVQCLNSVPIIGPFGYVYTFWFYNKMEEIHRKLKEK